MTDFAQVFQNDHKTFQKLYNKIGPLLNQVIPSHHARSHDCLMRMVEFIQ